jgi:hypothetical protein
MSDKSDAASAMAMEYNTPTSGHRVYEPRSTYPMLKGQCQDRRKLALVIARLSKLCEQPRYEIP